MQPLGSPRAHLRVAVVGEPQAARADVADGRAAEDAHDLGGAPAVIGHRQHVRHARRQRPQVPCAQTSEGSACGMRFSIARLCCWGAYPCQPLQIIAPCRERLLLSGRRFHAVQSSTASNDNERN